MRQSTTGRRLVVVRRRLAAAAADGQRALEGVSEVAIEECVDERVECRVDVSNPEQNGDDERRSLGTEITAQRVIDVPREERQPAAQERTRDVVVVAVAVVVILAMLHNDTSLLSICEQLPATAFTRWLHHK